MPDQYGAGDIQRRQKLVEIVGEPVHRPAMLGAVGCTVAPLIVGDGARRAGDLSRDLMPVLRAAQPAVHEYDGQAGALVDVAQVDPVGGNDHSVADRGVLTGAHTRLPFPVPVAQWVRGQVGSVGSDRFPAWCDVLTATPIGVRETAR